jgi:hypothetical protein
MERVNQLILLIKKWNKRIKRFMIIKKIVKIIIAILGPAMSLFLTADNILNKDS